MTSRTIESRGQRTTSAGAPGGGASAATRSATTKVLVVEDDASVRKSTIALLTALGYATEAVSSGEQALATYSQAQEAQAPYDVVLLDQLLSGHIGGVETLRLLRKIDPSVRAILLSGQACEPGDTRIRRIGFQCCLQKPVSMSDLRAAIEGSLK